MCIVLRLSVLWRDLFLSVEFNMRFVKLFARKIYGAFTLVGRSRDASVILANAASPINAESVNMRLASQERPTSVSAVF